MTGMKGALTPSVRSIQVRASGINALAIAFTKYRDGAEDFPFSGHEDEGDLRGMG